MGIGAFIFLFSKKQKRKKLSLTSILQTSSATLEITMAVATQGLITPNTSVALVLGENVGTTITAYLASLKTRIDAKRTAYAHILIKIFLSILLSLIHFSII